MNAIKMISIISLLVTILLGSHFFVYFSLVRFFSITNYRSILAVLFLLLAVSFFFFSIIAHWVENLFTRAGYLLSGFWLGILTNLVLAFLIAWLIIGLSVFIKVNINTKVLGSVFIALAVGYSLYGFWNAFHPQVKKIRISIADLPEQWRNKKIVQISDVHIGHIHQDKLVGKIVKEINLINPEMVVITGDFFDGMDGDLAVHLRKLNDIKAEKGIYFVTGNHETYLGVDRVYRDLGKTKTVILKDEVIDVDGLKLIGISYPQREERKDEDALLKSLKKDFYGKPNILLYHAPTNLESARKNGVKAQLSGHTHQGQLFPFNLVTRIMFGKYDYGLHNIGDFVIYTTSGVGTWGPPIRTGNRPEIVEITLVRL